MVRGGGGTRPRLGRFMRTEMGVGQGRKALFREIPVRESTEGGRHRASMKNMEQFP